MGARNNYKNKNLAPNWNETTAPLVNLAYTRMFKKSLQIFIQKELIKKKGFTIEIEIIIYQQRLFKNQRDYTGIKII